MPDEFKDRLFYQHNPTVTPMRTTVEENSRIGEEIGRKVAASTGPAAIYLPLQGVSAIDADGQAFDAPDARRAFFEAVRRSRGQIEPIELEHHINDPDFADSAANMLLQLIQGGP